MKIAYYDVTLRRIKESDKELIRYWRNHEKVRSKMEFREFITPEMHDEWFEKMNDYTKAFAFIIEYQNTSAGVIFNTNSNSHSSGGMFIWDDKCLDTQIPVIVSVVLTDVNFYLLGNVFSYISILKDNLNSIQFNKKFGYQLLDAAESKYNQQYFLSEERYRNCAMPIKDSLSELYGYVDCAKIVIEKEDVDSGLYDLYKNLYRGSQLAQQFFILQMQV